MHFCEVVARVYGRCSFPRKTSLNWFIPAFVKSSVGSSPGTSGELGTMRWPCFSKYLRNDERISFEVIADYLKASGCGLWTQAAPDVCGESAGGGSIGFPLGM